MFRVLSDKKRFYSNLFPVFVLALAIRMLFLSISLFQSDESINV